MRQRRVEQRRLERAHRLLGPRLVLLFLAGCLAFGPPFLGLFSRPSTLAGIPTLFVYLFAAWALFILALALLVELPRVQRGRGRRDRRELP
jgi:hypothetical protein